MGIFPSLSAVGRLWTAPALRFVAARGAGAVPGSVGAWLSLIADSPAERIAQLAIDGFRAGHTGSRDLRMRGNIHLTHLFDRHIRIWIGKRMSVKHELPLKDNNFH